MAKDDLIHISITRVIHSERWRIIRMLTKVWEFAESVSTIEEVSILEKSRNVIKTQWRIMFNDLPVRWVEEDTLRLRDNIISFKAVQGDLAEFHGEWKFTEHPHGTEVHIDIYLNVGIPAIEEFANEQIKSVVEKNFELIMDSLEKRLISSRYSSFKEGNIDKVAGFGILGHCYNYNHMIKYLKTLDPNFKVPSIEFLGKLFHITPAFKWFEMDQYQSKTGATTHGSFILCTFIPDMVDNNIEAVYSKVVSACKLAEKSGAGIVTLGGLTSIVAERFGERIKEDVDIPITSGNTYTVALAIDGVEKAAQHFDRDMKDLNVTIVGGSGDIGSGCARILASKVKHLTLTGRNGRTLRALKSELKKIGTAKIETSKDNKKAIKDADIVIASANSSASILDIEWFKSGSIVCDLAYPKNISYTATREDIFVFSGGLASGPLPIDTGVNMGIPSGDVCYGCFCEAIILALERRYENFSFGRGNIMPDKVDEIRTIAQKHGFELGPFFWADKMLDEDQLEQMKLVVK